MKTKILLILLMTGLVGMPLVNLHAATIDEVISQVNAYKASGELFDDEFASNLVNILNFAKSKQNAGDTAGKQGYLEAFRAAVDGGGGALMTSAAASNLISMAQ